MAYEQHIRESMAQFESDGEISLKQKSKSLPAATDSENTNGCFDCNICLDSAHDPVVTLCGHLYCWPCIYKWLNVETSSFEPDENPKCPVCKAKISESSLVPLYGRGSSTSGSDTKKPQLGLIIPRRPNFTTNPNQQIRSYPFQSQPQPQPFHQQQYLPPNPYASYAPMASPNNFSPTTVGMIGEMVFARMFGNMDMGLFPYPYSNAAPLVGNGSPRMRRQEMEVDKSLNRVTIFLFCCLVLCLLLF